mgnify:CR=1 FL=1
MPRSWPAVLGLLLILAPAASAQTFEVEEEDDDFSFEGEESEEEAPDRLEEDDDLTVNEDDESLEEFVEPAEGGQDLLGEEDQPRIMGPGGDSEQIYRATVDRLAKMPADEQLLGWDQYLADYPNTVFRERILARKQELEDQLYANPSGRRPTTGNTTGRPGVDAQDQELDFAHAMQLGQLNTRSRIQAGFEWGLPNYINLFADYEKAFSQRVSAHVGVRRRYSGFSIEAGPRLALVKSPRTQTIVTFIPDFHFNTNPGFPALSPTIAAGKRFGKLDAQLHGAVDIELRSETDEAGTGTTTGIRTRFHGGASFYYAATDTVGFFGETYLNMRQVQADNAFDGRLFSFNVVTFGMKFFPSVKSRPGEQPIETNVGATVPYQQSYWQYHYGSIMAQMNYYPED